MEIRIAGDRYALGKSAARHIAAVLREVIAEKGHARMVLSTGASQFDTLEALTKEEGIAWDCVEMFHLDEYIGLPVTSKRMRYLLSTRYTGASNGPKLTSSTSE